MSCIKMGKILEGLERTLRGNKRGFWNNLSKKMLGKVVNLYVVPNISSFKYFT